MAYTHQEALEVLTTISLWPQETQLVMGFKHWGVGTWD